MDVVVARKIGAPDQPEYGIGAISEDERPVFNPTAAHYFDFNDSAIQATIRDELLELRRRIKLYRNGRSLKVAKGRTILVVDDGLATGVTAVAAGGFLKSLNPARLILAVPVGPTSVNPMINELFDEVICLHLLDNFRGIGLWYANFEQVDDKEVLGILQANSLPIVPRKSTQEDRHV